MLARLLQFVIRWRAACCLLLGVSLLLIGCSTQKRYQVLTVFFDGVPDPNAPKVANNRRTQTIGSAVVTLVVHKPYEEQNCGGCHLNTDNILARAKVPPDVCQKCHASTVNEHPIMHGPVAAGACSKCHAPHQSRHPNLLREAVPKVCVQCHTPELLGPVPTEHLDPKSNCISCHSGHGGTDRALLKPGWQANTTRPATQPAPEAEAPK